MFSVFSLANIWAKNFDTCKDQGACRIAKKCTYGAIFEILKICLESQLAMEMLWSLKYWEKQYHLMPSILALKNSVLSKKYFPHLWCHFHFSLFFSISFQQKFVRMKIYTKSNKTRSKIIDLAQKILTYIPKPYRGKSITQVISLRLCPFSTCGAKKLLQLRCHLLQSSIVGKSSIEFSSIHSG